MKDLTIADHNKHKKRLRKQDVNLGTVKVTKEQQQARDFIETHNKRDIDAFLRIYDTEMFADLLDWLVIKDAVFNLNKDYNTFPSDIASFVKEMNKARK